MSDSDKQASSSSPPAGELPPELIAQEVARLNEAVREAARDLGFDDQPGDFLALLIALREPEDRLR